MLPDVWLDDDRLENPPAVVKTLEGTPQPPNDQQADDFDFGDWTDAVRQRVEKLVRRAETGELAHLDQAIDHLENLEDELKRVRVQLQIMLGRAEQLRGEASHMSSWIRSTLAADVAQVEESVKQILSPVEAVLRTYRDGRWSLMAIQARCEPEGEAPVFDDPDALLAYLQK